MINQHTEQSMKPKTLFYIALTVSLVSLIFGYWIAQ